MLVSLKCGTHSQILRAKLPLSHMPKKILSLGSDGKLVLKLPDGRTEAVMSDPPTALLLIDASSSMEGNNLLQAKSGAFAFSEDAFNKGYQVGVIQFASRASWVSEPTKDFRWLKTCVDRLLAGGSTNMTDAVRLATDALLPKRTQRVIVVVTDGNPDNSAEALMEAQKAKDSGIEIIAIGTDDANHNFIRQLASRSDLTIKVPAHQLGQSIASAARLLSGPSR